MTKEQVKVALTEVKAMLSEDEDLFRELLRAVVQEVLEQEMTEALGAGKGERCQTRLGYRSGYYHTILPRK